MKLVPCGRQILATGVRILHDGTRTSEKLRVGCGGIGLKPGSPLHFRLDVMVYVLHST